MFPAHSRASGNPELKLGHRFRGDERIILSPLPASPLTRRSRRRALLARAGPARGRRPASGKRLELCRARQLLPPYDTRRDAGASCPPDRALRAARAWSRSATASMTAAVRRGFRRGPRQSACICSAGATGSGSPATTIPSRPTNIGGDIPRQCSRSARLTFRHLPAGADGEIAGHLHPVARVSHRGRAVSRRCFAADKTRMVMPAFGAFTGGFNVRDAAFADLFGTLAFTAHMLGEGRLYAFAAKRCLPD